jgi:NAD(P)H-nitrite reductase large subunit
MKVVIVGGVAGGASAAARLRRLDETCKIVIFERSGYISYANCGLPYYIGDVITEEKNLTLQTPESFYNRFKINVKVKHEVLEIDTLNKCVKVIDLSTDNIFYEQYDKLILSCGAKPKLPLFYEENPRIFTLRTVEDTYKIKSYINQANFISLKCRNKLIKILSEEFSIELPLENYANIDIQLTEDGNIIMREDVYKAPEKITFEEVEQKY